MIRTCLRTFILPRNSGIASLAALESGNLEEFGQLMDVHCSGSGRARQE